MDETALLNSIFKVIECITDGELGKPGRQLAATYFKNSDLPRLIERARWAVRRYAQMDIPGMPEIKVRYEAKSLEEVDYLILDMEEQARKLEQKSRPG